MAAVNMSLGGEVYLSPAECDADNGATKAIIDTLRSVGIATVAAAGNKGAANGIGAPGCISSAISVGSTTKADAVSSFSNSAPFLSLLAPGSSIRSSVPGGGFAFFSGTSMATAHVTGAWAVMKQKNPEATVTAVLDALIVTGRSISDPKNGIVKPRIDVAGAVALGAAQALPALTVNGNSTPITVAAGATVTVGVQDGPDNRTDWLGLYQTGAADNAYLNWFYLNGTKTAPATGITTATVPFALPSTPGAYEFRFFSNNGFSRLATGPTVTVQGGGALTLTVNGSSTPISGAPRATVTVGVQSGPGNHLDWVGLYPTGAPESGYLSYLYLYGSTSASLPFTLPGTPGTYEFRFFPNNSFTRLATSPTVTVQGDGTPILTVNGSSTPISGAPGATVTVGVQNGPGNQLDWVGLYPTGAPESGYLSYLYLYGSTSASLPFTLPGTSGTYEFRFFPNNGFTRLATSPTATVP